MQTPETLVAQRRPARQARQRFVEGLCASLPDLHKTVGEFLSALMAQTGTQREMQTRRDAWLLYQQHQAAWLDGTAKAWRDAVLPAASAGPGGRAVNLSFELLRRRCGGKQDRRLSHGPHGGRAGQPAVRLLAPAHPGAGGQDMDSTDILRAETICLKLVEQWVEAGLPAPICCG